MPLYFAYGSNMNAEAMARRCPRSKAVGLARLERHRLAVMREGWLTVSARPARLGARRPVGSCALRRSGARPLRGLRSTPRSSSRSSPKPGRSGRSSISAPMRDPGPCGRTIWPRSSPRRAPGRCRPRRSRRSSGWATGPRRYGANNGTPVQSFQDVRRQILQLCGLVPRPAPAGTKARPILQAGSNKNHRLFIHLSQISSASSPRRGAPRPNVCRSSV